MQDHKKTVSTTSLITKLACAALCLAVIGAGTYWFYTAKQSSDIYEYNPSIDRSFIIDLFKKDWYWLISDYSSKDYSVEHMLDNKASSKEKSGDLIIKTMRIKGEPVGFVAYFLKEFYEGWILFLAIDKQQRSRGYARKLLHYALDDLKKRGATVIRLITRVDNVPGQTLYKSEGFKQIWTDGAYLKFEKVLAG